MKDTEFTKLVNEVIELKLKAADEYIESVIEPLTNIGSPEKLIGKPYEAWTTQDLRTLMSVYGKEPNPLSRLIRKKEFERARRIQRENILTPEQTWGGIR